MQAMGRTSMAGSSIGTRKIGEALLLRSCREVRASRKHHWAIVAYEVQIFWPVMRQPSPSRRAAVCSDARSEPASGSLKPWHQMTSPRAIGGRCGAAAARRCRGA